MKGQLISIVSILAIGIGALVFALSMIDPVEDDGSVTVAATIFPLADIVQQIGGKEVRVVQLLPAGASPHSYTVSPQQLVDLSKAKAIFQVGYGIDDWVTQAAESNGDTTVITVDNNIELREFSEDHGHDDEHEDESNLLPTPNSLLPNNIDPHYWLTIPNGQEIAKTVTRTLQEIDPEHSSDYESNLEVYLVELNKAESELQALLRASDRPGFIAIHDAWGYFSEHYGLELLAAYEPVEGQEPTAQDIQRLQEIVSQRGVTTFFTEPQKQSTAATRFIKEDLGLSIDVLDPIGGTDNRDSYINLIRENVVAILTSQN